MFSVFSVMENGEENEKYFESYFSLEGMLPSICRQVFKRNSKGNRLNCMFV